MSTQIVTQPKMSGNLKTKVVTKLKTLSLRRTQTVTKLKKSNSDKTWNSKSKKLNSNCDKT